MSETRTVFDPFELKAVAISNRLVDRLRGKYASGPHLPNGNPEFGWRQFEAPPIQHEAADVIEAKDAEITSLRAQLDEARKQIEIKTESDAYRNHPRYDVLTYSFRMVGYYRSEDGTITRQQADNLAHMMAHSWNEVRTNLANALGFENPGDLERGVRSFKSQLDEARRKAIEDAANTAEQHSRLDVRCKCGFEIAEDIRALLSESKT